MNINTPKEPVDKFVPDDFFEPEYTLNNRIRITLNIESYETEVKVASGWVPVHEYVTALIQWADTRVTSRAIEELERLWPLKEGEIHHEITERVSELRLEGVK